MILQVAGIKFSYNHIPILRDVSFELSPGKVMGVLGVNGAGKSTLLKCLNRVLSPSTGTILMSHKDIRTLSRTEIAQHFGYVPQNKQEETLTVFETVLLGRKPYIKWSATRRDLAIVENVLHRLELDRFAQRPANRLSGGEYQKVMIARALAQEPAVLLLDEPTSNLDIKNQLQVMDIIRQAVREFSISAIVSLHDINLALRYADDFLMLKEGTVHALAPFEQITAEAIESVYDIRVTVGEMNGHRFIIPDNY